MIFDPEIHRRKSRPRHVYRQEWSVRLERPVPEVFEFCLDGANFQKIAPNRIEPVPETDEIIVKLDHVYPFKQWTAGIPTRWTMHVVELVPNVRFVDELLKGPMRYVRHTHLFRADGAGTIYTDVLEYRPYLALLLHPLFVQREVDSTFKHRQREMQRLLTAAP
jgi:ligand-binding SRPBCC domain-containing protein